MAEPARTRVLVVEDDPDDARIIFRALRKGRFEPVHVRSGSEGLEAAAAGPFGVCLVDYRLPDMSGIEMCRRLRAMGLVAPILLLSSVQADEVVARALAAGANDFLVKHLSFGERLDDEVHRVLVT